jgi:tetratricopeptide (TPR) repeat protein
MDGKADQAMQQFNSVADLERRVREQMDALEYADALTTIAVFVGKVIANDAASASVYGSAALDQLCQAIGAAFPQPAPAPLSDTAVVLATTMAPTGGHSRVIADILNADPATSTRVLLTDMFNEMDEGQVRNAATGTGLAVERAPTANPAAKLVWLKQRLAEIGAQRVYIVPHHFDAVLTAAIQADLAGQFVYYHNCDHNLALGVHLPGCEHVDYNAKGFFNCRERLGIAHNSYWPLAVADRFAERRGRHESKFTTACCGGFEKFELAHVQNAIPYAIAYPDVVAETLRHTGGRHVHIGPLTQDTVAAIAEALEQAGVARDRFVLVPYVPDLAAALADFAVDIYMGSMPRGGGRATVEAMMAGMPLLLHSNYRSIMFSDENEVYEGAWVWRDLADLRRCLGEIDAPALAHHSQLARDHYLRHHTPEAFLAATARTRAGDRTPPQLRRPVDRTDPLQSFLDQLKPRIDRRPAGEHSAPPPLQFAPSDLPKSTASAALPTVFPRDLLPLLRAHAQRRGGIEAIGRADQHFSPDAFEVMVRHRYERIRERNSNGLGALAERDARAFITYEMLAFQRSVREPATMPADAAKTLHLADILKLQGHFADALFLYDEVAAGAGAEAAGSAARGKADLLITLGRWAAEYRDYSCEGRALDPYEEVPTREGSDRWYVADLPTALEAAREAVRIAPDHPDALWLLATAAADAELWPEATAAAERLAALIDSNPELEGLRARCAYAVDRPRADAAVHRWTGGDPFWQAYPLLIRKTLSVPADKGVTRRLVGEPMSQPVESNIVFKGEIARITRSLDFDQPHVATVKRATILPEFSMVQVGREYLLADTLHHHRIHFPLFTSSVRFVSNDTAFVVSGPPGARFRSPHAFIGSNGNYYHWLLDCLPRLDLLHERERQLPLLIDRNTAAWQIDLLERFGVKEDQLVRANLLQPTEVDTLVMPSHLSTLMVVHPDAIAFVRNTLLGSRQDATPRRGKRLYVGRLSASGRAMLNESEVRARFRRADFEFVDPGTMTIPEQIDLFHDAEVIAGPGGAGLSNIVLAPRGAKLLNLTSADIVCQTFTSITSVIGQESWFCAGASVARPFRYWINTNFDFSIDVGDVDLALEAML